jgi:large subunit ribosomal protein L6
MSRIGKKPISIPAGVKVAVAQRKVSVEGPAGKLEHTFPEGVAISSDGKIVNITRTGETKQHKAFHGLTRALLNNMINGAKTPFEKTLEIHGTGFGATVAGKDLELEIGFSNKIKMAIPKGIELKADKGRPVILRVIGADKQAVGQFSAEIRKLRPPSPYGENKGIRYKDEVIRKKAGKAFGEKK